MELWPENAAAFDVFCRLGTQWRMSVRGPIGLDYGPLPFVLRMARVPRDQWEDIFHSVQIMENAALAAINEG